MESALFIGNGLNRCYKNSVPWGELLKSIAVNNGSDYDKNNPMALEFERIMNSILQKMSKPNEEIYHIIKSEIAQKLLSAELPENALHKNFVNLPVDNILTSNYDYMLEKAYNSEYRISKDSKRSEMKYSLNRKLIINEKNFYHVHGEAEKEDTICLGYEHYSGYLQKIRSEIHSRTKDELKIKQILLNKVLSTGSWPELFFTHDIYMIGFGLDISEIDVWWVLTYRAYLYYADICEVKNLIKNTIYFYSIQMEDKKSDDKYKSFIHLLENINIECITYTIKSVEEYKIKYMEICDDISKKLKPK